VLRVTVSGFLGVVSVAIVVCCYYRTLADLIRWLTTPAF